MNPLKLAELRYQKRTTIWRTTLFLALVMLLYFGFGMLILLFFASTGNPDWHQIAKDGSRVRLFQMVQMLSQVLVLAMPVVIMRLRHGDQRYPMTRVLPSWSVIRIPLPWPQMLTGAFGILLLQPLVQAATLLQNLYLWPALGEAGAEVLRLQGESEQFMRTMFSVRTIPDVMMAFLVLVMTPSICEELLFRGYVQQNYEISMGRGGAVALTGLLFAFFHGSAANLLSLALLGGYIGYIYSKTRNLAVPVAAHFANNFFALMALFSEQSDVVLPLSETLWSGWFVVVASLVCLLPVLGYFSRMAFSGDAG